MRITRWAAVAALGVAAGAVALAGPAHAQDGHFPDGGWQVRDIALGSTAWSDPGFSEISDATTAHLTKPDGTTGTSIETTNLGLAVKAGDSITVDYLLSLDAETTAGAIRMFYYDHPDADTLGAAPTATAVADGSGALTLDVAADGTIGTFGLTYDASNASAGTVTFLDLMVGDTPILFVAPPEPDPDPQPTDPAGPECVDVNTAAADDLTMLKHIDDVLAAEILQLRPFSSVADLDRVDGLKSGGPRLAELVKGGDGFLPLCEIAAPGGQAGGGGDDDDKGGLPVTGSSLPLLVGAGVVLGAAGGGLYWLSRRRRGVSFTA